MRALVNTAPGKVEWSSNWPIPEPGAGEVRIRTAACGICATDLEMIKGWERTAYPSIPGHEWSGIVDVVGAGVDGSLAGRPCVAENVLADGGEVGFEHAGGYGEYLVTEARNLYLLPAAFPLAAAALIEPLAVCVRGLKRLRLEQGQPVLVFGDGPIGLLMLLLLKAEGVDTVALVGGREARLAIAKRFGASAVLDFHTADNLTHAVRNLPGAPFPNVIEATGSPLAIQTAIEAARACGKVLVLGDYAGAQADFAWNHLLHRELELIGSNASSGAWPAAVEMALSGRLPLGELISHRLPAASGVEALELTKTSQQIVKVVLDWGT